MAYQFSTDNINRNFGTVEDIEYTAELNIIEEPRYMQILKLVKSGIGLDLSQRSTGIVIWKDGKLDFAVVDLGAYQEVSEMRDMLKESIIEVVGEGYYQVIAIEGIYGGKNFSVVKTLMSLNTVPSELLEEGKLSCDIFNNVDNQIWKSTLRQLKKIKGSLKPKLEIRKMLEYLEFPIESLSRFNNSGKSDRDQDLLDALGVLLATILDNFVNSTNRSKEKLGLKDMKLWYCDSLDVYEACYNDGEEFLYFDVDKNLRLELINKIKETNANCTLVTEVPTDLLGRFGLEYNIPFTEEYVCIIATPKDKSKPRMKKAKIIR